jgi:protein subunit release factor B
MKILKAKLYQLEEDKKRAEMERQYGEKGEIAWEIKFVPTFFSHIKW